MFDFVSDSIDSGTLLTGRPANPKVLGLSLEARTLFERAAKGNIRARATLQEAMSTSDFPILLGISYARELTTEYRAIAPVWQRISHRTTTPDFRERSLVDVLGGKGTLDVVKEGAEYPAAALTESARKFKVRKRGRRIPLTWEMIVNDDLGAFRNLPGRLAIAARETEDVVTVDALLNPSRTGVNTAFFRAQTGNAPANVPLTRENLIAARDQIKQRKSDDERPIDFGGEKIRLMVGQSLETTARGILAAREIRTTDGSVETIEVNTLGDEFELVVNPWWDIRANFANAATTWFLLPAPSPDKPALVTAFLAGHEAPDLRVKADQGNRAGGGLILPEEGSFDTDTIDYRVRHVTDAAPLFEKRTYVSLGA